MPTFDNNILLLSDSYKAGQWKQYPPQTTTIYSYFEAREGAQIDRTVFFGLQYLLKRYLTGQVVDLRKIELAEALIEAHVGPGIFNREGWEYILFEHGGRLPVEIKAVPEGTAVNNSNVLMTVENTDPACFWLTSYLETLLVQVWYPCTVASISRKIKGDLAASLLRTGGSLDGLPFMLHDFGFRGVSSVESAAIGDAAHLVNFSGGDTIAGIRLLQEFYGADEMPSFNIPASEHSTMTSWGRDREVDAYRNMLEQFPTGLVSVVSDSYDIYAACEHIWGDELKEQVLSRDGRLVVRPDSGNPRYVVPKVLATLWDAFGGTTNANGYRVLDDHVRVIQGDGIDVDSVDEILGAVEKAGFAAENLVFGSGGGLLQKMNRDTQRFAFKCSYANTDRGPVDVYKDPATANQGHTTKRSKKGRLKLVDSGNGVYTTYPEALAPTRPDVLRPVFRNGEVLVDDDLATIRDRARIEQEAGRIKTEAA